MGTDGKEFKAEAEDGGEIRNVNSASAEKVELRANKSKIDGINLGSTPTKEPSGWQAFLTGPFGIAIIGGVFLLGTAVIALLGSESGRKSLGCDPPAPAAQPAPSPGGN